MTENYVHQIDSSRWVVAELRPDGSYVAPLRAKQPGGVHSYQSRSLRDLATADVYVYQSRSSALRRARVIWGGE